MPLWYVDNRLWKLHSRKRWSRSLQETAHHLWSCESKNNIDKKEKWSKHHQTQMRTYFFRWQVPRKLSAYWLMLRWPETQEKTSSVRSGLNQEQGTWFGFEPNYSVTMVTNRIWVPQRGAILPRWPLSPSPFTMHSEWGLEVPHLLTFANHSRNNLLFI